MKSFILFTAIVFYSVTIFAGEGKETPNTDNNATYSIEGEVVDEVSGESLVGVAVRIGNQTVYTDFDGQFKLENIAKDQQTIETSYVAYENKKINLVPGKTQILKIKLKEK